MYGGIRIDDEQRTRAAAPGSARSCRSSSAPSSAAQVVDERVEGDAARRLDEDRRRRRPGAAGAPRARPAGRRPRRRDPGLMPAARAARGDRLGPRRRPRQQVGDTGRGRCPTSRWPASWPVAQLEHLAEDGDAPAGQAGQERPAPRASRPGPRCSCRRRSSRRPARIELAAVRRRRRDGQPARDLVEVEPGRAADRRRGERVVDGVPAEARQADGRARPALGAGVEAHAVRTGATRSPRRVTSASGANP